MKNGDPDVALVTIKNKPRVLEWVCGIPQDVHVPGGCVSLHTQDGNLSRPVFCHIHYHDSVAILVIVARWIDQHIARLHILDGPGLRLMVQ